MRHHIRSDGENEINKNCYDFNVSLWNMDNLKIPPKRNDSIMYCKIDIHHLDDQCLKCRFCAKWCNRSVKKKKKEFDGNFVVL